jgi:CubicO group peptidase (beta-lactamase class C family)
MNRLRASSKVFLALLMLTATGPACAAPTPENAPTVASSSTSAFEWKRSTPEEQGVDSEMLLEAVRRIRDDDLDIRSLVLVRNDHIILELYVHPYDRDTLHNVKSVSKSIISALVGIALEEGILESLDQTVEEFFPQYFTEGMDESKKQITLRHLITMTAGLDLDENGPKMAKVFASDDWIRAALEAPMADDPGASFLYSTPLTHTMSGILTEASGMSLLELADARLFGPLGIETLQWTQGPRGYYFGGAELFLRPIDMAKFGQLFLHDGKWQDEQVVPAEWVAESTRNQVPDGSRGRYGYWWWLAEEEGEVTAVKAMGWGGQGITVMPQLGMVAAGTAGHPRAPDRMFRGFDPSSFTDEPLPPNPEAVAELERLVHELGNPEPQPVPPLPEIAAKISGRTWVADENPRGFRSFAFHFDADPSVFRVAVEQATEALEAEVGLDGLYRMNDTGPAGSMPDDNRLAARGRWTKENELILESHQVGNPVHATWTVRFNGDRLEATALVQPLGQSFVITAAASEPETGKTKRP